MDYHAIHGHDLASFDVPPTNRLPTIAASQALDELKDDRATRIPTGIEALDLALLSSEAVDSQRASRHGGIKRGQVTEIWGPPGAGKTAIGLQLAANTFHDGHGVVWIDCFQETEAQRFLDVVQHVRAARTVDSANVDRAEETNAFTQYFCQTLPHLLALISGYTTRDIPSNTSLLVISGISALVNAGLPRSSDGKAPSKQGTGRPPSVKRLQGLHYIISELQKRAASKNLAVVLLSQCATSMKSEQGASLVPAINATVWEQGISTRVVLFRDWTWHDQKSSSVFLAGLQKTDGRIAQGSIEHICAFNVAATGISGAEYEAAEATRQSFSHEATFVPITPRQKRKRGNDEPGVIADSEDEDEDYGWADEDEDSLPPPMSQWQGSEDLIMGQDRDLSEDPEGPNDEVVDEEAPSSGTERD